MVSGKRIRWKWNLDWKWNSGSIFIANIRNRSRGKNDITDEFGYIVENGNAVKIKIVKEADVHEKDIS